MARRRLGRGKLDHEEPASGPPRSAVGETQIVSSEETS